MASANKGRMHVVDEDGDEDDRQERRRRKKKKKKSTSSKKDKVVPLLFAAVGGALVAYVATKHLSKKDEERREADTKARERDLERMSSLFRPAQQQALPPAAVEQPAPALLFSFMEDD